MIRDRDDKYSKGFTLVEIAIALVMIGLLTVTVSKFSQELNNDEKIMQTVYTAEDVQQQLLTFLMTNKFLPCPDTLASNDGSEDRDADNSCTSRRGYLPTATLGINAEDAWGNPFYYRVVLRAEQVARIRDIEESASVFGNAGAREAPSGSFGYCPDTNQYYLRDCTSTCDVACVFGAEPRESDAPPYFHFSTRPFGADTGYNSNLVIRDSKSGNVLNETAVAVVVSFGVNGQKTWHSVKNNSACTASDVPNLTERENCDNDNNFLISGRVPIEGGTSSLLIDDKIIWIDFFEAKAKMANRGDFN